MASAERALDLQPIDVVFPDIQMPRASGSRCWRAGHQRPRSRHWSSLSRPTTRTAIEAFDCACLDYVLKPLTTRLAAVLARATQMLDAGASATDAESLRRHAAAEPAYWEQVAVRSVGMIETSSAGRRELDRGRGQLTRSCTWLDAACCIASHAAAWNSTSTQRSSARVHRQRHRRDRPGPAPADGRRPSRP